MNSVFFVTAMLVGQCGGHSAVSSYAPMHCTDNSTTVNSENWSLTSGYSGGCGECDYVVKGVGIITLDVPAESLVWINNYLTKSVGTRREYKSYLDQGYSYDYTVFVKYNDVTKYSKVSLIAGDNKQIAFDFSMPVKEIERKPELQSIPVKIKSEPERKPELQSIPVKIKSEPEEMRDIKIELEKLRSENIRLKGIIDHNEPAKLQVIPDLDTPKGNSFLNYDNK